MHSRTPVVFLAAACLMSVNCRDAYTQTTVNHPNDTLTSYVQRPDDSFGWTVKKESRLGKTAYAELLMTSQNWRGKLWRHQLFILMPKSTTDTNSALLVITGGAWDDKLASPDYTTKLPVEAAVFAAAAEKLGMPVAVLLQVPQQPLFDDLYEDALIAHTFEQYLKTGDSDWPLLLPMVKSAVAAMDTTQQFLKQKEQPQVEKFVVTGASKRGWTTWLSAVADKRVQAIAPMVIDVLNMPQQMKYMEECWGEQSQMISDYTERGLHDALDTEKGRQLTEIVDPYAYCQQLTQPKLVLLGTNDPYWPVDALNIYWDQLGGKKHILYVPNAGHGLEQDLPRVLGGLVAFSRRAAAGRSLPKMTWKHQRDGDQLQLKMQSGEVPNKAVLWTATSQDRDFRNEKWSSIRARANGDGWIGQTVAGETGFQAVFGEFSYEGDAMPFTLSTTICVYGLGK